MPTIHSSSSAPGAPGAGSGRVRPAGGLPRPLAVTIGLAAAVVVVTGLKAASGIIGPAFLALVLTITAHPLRVVLGRHMRSWVAGLVCMVVVIGSMVGFIVVIVAAIARFGTLVSHYQGDFDARVNDAVGRLESLGVSPDRIQTLAHAMALTKLGGAVSDVLSGVMSLASALFLIFSLVIFMSLDSAAFPTQLAAVARVRPVFVEALVGFAGSTRRYLVVATVFGFIVALCDTGALALMGVPAPLLWGLLAFLTNYIPNIGFVIGLIPPAVLALLDSGPGLCLAVIAVYCLLNLVIQSIIQPKVVGDAVGLSTTLTFLSLVFWAWVLGPVGAVLAVPFSLLVRAIWVDGDPDSRWLLPVIANAPDEAPPQVEAGGTTSGGTTSPRTVQPG